MKKIAVYIDAGHGGIFQGRYYTPPHVGKLYTFLDKKGKEDFTIYEGEVNRKIAGKFAELCEKEGIFARKIYHDYLDTPLLTRCHLANTFFLQDKLQGYTPILLSFHSNAFGNSSKGEGEAPRGWSVWTSKGKTEADKIAQIWAEETKKMFGKKITIREDLSDGDSDFEENFTILVATVMPAVLVENLFFTNREDAKLLLSEDYQNKSALVALNTVQRYARE